MEEESLVAKVVGGARGEIGALSGSACKGDAGGVLSWSGAVDVACGCARVLKSGRVDVS